MNNYFNPFATTTFPPINLWNFWPLNIHIQKVDNDLWCRQHPDDLQLLRQNEDQF